MQRELEYNEPTFHGMDFNNSIRVKHAFKAVVTSVSELTEQLNQVLNNPNYMVVNGKTIQQHLDGASGWRSGEIKKFHCSWDDAVEICREEGAVFCDGRNGSPQFHPDPDVGGSPRYFKATSWGCDSGSIGGTTTHGHEATICIDEVDISHEHEASSETTCHSHSTSFCTCEPSNSVEVRSGSGIYVASCDHYHDAELELTDDGEHNHPITVQPCEEDALKHHTHTGEVEVASGSHDPPHVEVIALMKL